MQQALDSLQKASWGKAPRRLSQKGGGCRSWRCGFLWQFCHCSSLQGHLSLLPQGTAMTFQVDLLRLGALNSARHAPDSCCLVSTGVQGLS